jgi:hypothetical protein
VRVEPEAATADPARHGERVASRVDDDPAGDARAARRVDLLALVFFALVAYVFAIPRWPSAWASEIPGDHGDALLNLWILEWVGHHAGGGWSALWDTTIFWPNDNTLAYSESLLPVALVHRVLAGLLGSGVLAFNVVHLAAWTLSGWVTYLLARRLGVAVPGALVAGLVYTIACPRLVHVSHFQLGMGFLVPLTLLTLFWFFERPGARRGAVLGLVAATCALSATYYGLVTAITLTMVVPALALVHVRDAPWRPVATGLAAAAAVGAVFVLPVANQYRALQEDPHFRREPEPAGAAHLAVFLRVSPAHVLLAGLPPFESRSRPESATIENRLYPGLPAVALGAAGLVVVLRRARAGDRASRRLLALLAPAGVLFACSFGDRLEVGGRSIWMPYSALRDLPGFSGIRATARFVVLPLLVLAVFAGIALAGVAARARTRAGRVAITAGTVVLIGAESLMTVGFARVPSDDADRAVNEALAGRGEGPVVELPMGSPSDGWPWAYVETPRQYLSLVDGLPRVNGYSGFAPPGFDELAATLETFPEEASLRALDRLGVRYVVLRTGVPDGLDDLQARVIGTDGVGVYSEVRAQAVIDALPGERVERVDRYGDAWLVELAR